MKRTYWLWIVLTTFTLGVVITAAWFKINPRVYKFEEVISSDAPKTGYCDLVNNPSKYDGKIVRLNANLYWLQHGYFLADDNCSGEGDSRRTAILFHEPKRDEIYKQLEKYMQLKPVEIIAVGVFTDKNPIGGSDHIADRTPLHFEVYNIEYMAR